MVLEGSAIYQSLNRHTFFDNQSSDQRSSGDVSHFMFRVGCRTCLHGDPVSNFRHVLQIGTAFDCCDMMVLGIVPKLLGRHKVVEMRVAKILTSTFGIFRGPLVDNQRTFKCEVRPLNPL